MDYAVVIPTVIIVIAAFLILLGFLYSKTDFSRFESDEKRAGRRGEQFAAQIIREILNDKDVLLTNVKVSFGDKHAELDSVIINNRGVFIIEVKNYSGELYGDEDDYEWIKNKYTPAGNFYQKSVKNPIKQVKRQVYILSHYLKRNGINVWIEGYAFLVEMNSPVDSSYILDSQSDIDSVIHLGINNRLTNSAKKAIVGLLAER